MKKYEYRIIMRILDLVERDMHEHQDFISKKVINSKKNEKEKNPTRAIGEKREAIHSTEASIVLRELEKEISSQNDTKSILRAMWKKLLRKINRNRKLIKYILILTELIKYILILTELIKYILILTELIKYILILI